MAGRAQAANLTGMLSQLASDVGEMGKAYDWTHNAVRTLSMPEVDENDPKSLEVYAEWARRNGKDDVAYAYSKRAADLAVEQQKRAYTKSVAQGKEAIRGLLSSKDALEAKPRGNNELYGEGGQLPIQAQINNVPGQIQAQVDKLNDLGDSSRYGTGVEGSTALREVNAERMQALKDAIALRKAGFELTEAEMKALEPAERRVYANESSKFQETITRLARTRNKTPEQEQELANAVSGYNALTTEYAHLSGVNAGAGTAYLDSAVDQFNQEVSASLSQISAQQGVENENSLRNGYAMADNLAGQGVYEVSEAQLAQLDPRTSKALNERLAEHKQRHDELLVAQNEGTVTPEDLAFAKSIDSDEARALVRAYERPEDQNLVSRKPAASALKKYINARRAQESSLLEGLTRETDINMLVKVVRENADITQVFGDDLADIFGDDEKREATVANIKTMMEAHGRTRFRSIPEFVEYATVAAKNAGFQVEDSDLTMATTADLAERAVTLEQLETSMIESVMSQYQSGGSNLPQAEQMKNAKASTQKAVDALMRFERMTRSDQLWNLNNPTPINNILKASGIHDEVKRTLEGQDERFTIQQLRVINDGE